MMWRYLAIILWLAGSPLLAQEVVVRTGDHPTFTRIVLSIPPGTEWEILRRNGGYNLHVAEPLRLNADLFFQRIQRDRIADVAQGESESELLINLACGCFAEAFQWRPDQVVIDIKDPDSPVAPDAIPIADLPAITTPIIAGLPESPLPPLVEQALPSVRLPIIMIEEAGSQNRELAIDPLVRLLDQQTRISTLENTVAGSLERALLQGLLEPGEESAILDQDQTIESDIADLLANLEATLSPGIIARTSMDQETIEAPAENTHNSAIECIPDTFVDVPSWSSDVPFAKLIGDLRGKLTGEFDKVDATAVEALAKAYITFGFGREAISTLSIDGLNSQSRSILQTLGEIIDNDPVSLDAFALQVGCPGHVAFWALLAHDTGPLAAQPDVPAMIVSFKLLPQPLRAYLAPRLARKLTQLGYQDFASDVLSVGDKQNVEVTTVETEILISRGETEEAATILSELANDDARITPDALMKLIAIQLAESRPIGANDLMLLRTFQFEVQDDALRKELFETEVRVLIAMKSYDAAQNLIGSAKAALGDEIAEGFRNEIFERIVADSSEPEFLNVAFDQKTEIIDPNTQNAYASRLLDLGFAGRAQDFISGESTGDAMMERRYLRAEAAFALGDTETGLAHLSGLATPRAQDLISTFVLREIAPVIGDTNAETNDPLLLAITERQQGITSFQQDTPTPLTDGRSLVSESSNLRANMATLLERYQISPSAVQN